MLPVEYYYSLIPVKNQRWNHQPIHSNGAFEVHQHYLITFFPSIVGSHTSYMLVSVVLMRICAFLKWTLSFLKWTHNLTCVLQIHRSLGSHVAPMVVELGSIRLMKHVLDKWSKIICGWPENTKTVDIKTGLPLNDTECSFLGGRWPLLWKKKILGLKTCPLNFFFFFNWSIIDFLLLPLS